MKKITINGIDYDASNGVVMTLFTVAQAYGGELSDYLFSSVIQEMEEDEDNVMWLMVNSHSPRFTRHPTGWSVDDI